MFRPFLLIAALLAPFPALAKPVTVKVVVLTMFEVGEETGDVAGEFQHWAERYPFTEKVKVPGIEHPVRVSPDGVVLVLAGMNARSRQSVTALALDPRFDTSKAYWLIAGIAGVDPASGSIGSAAWARWVVDADAAHDMDDREAPADWPWGIYSLGTRKPGLKGSAAGASAMAWKLDPGLVDWAYSLTHTTPLADNPQLQAARTNYVAAAARQPPKVYIGDVIGTARFWHGDRRTAWARDWVRIWTDGQGQFAMSDCEDHQVMDALDLLGPSGRVDRRRVLVLRTASNYTAAAPGADPVFDFAPGGLEAGVEAAYRVGQPVVKALVAGWDQYADQLPKVAQ
ncbi:purine nucleoside permease [Phenylobacterium sp.]|uniref:purine nucleoside permease n=1 Tax=Phenylobacterium sp. TaxID=1871053 RepID=UPI0037C6D250